MFPDDSTFFNSLRSIIKKMHQISDRELGALGISHAEMRIMLFLHGKNNCRQDELSLAMGIDRTNVGRSLKKLEGLGHIIREKDSEDARAFTVSLTEQGYEIQNELKTIKENIESAVTKGVSSRDLHAVSAILETMDNNLSWERYIAMKKVSDESGRSHS